SRAAPQAAARPDRTPRAWLGGQGHAPSRLPALVPVAGASCREARRRARVRPAATCGRQFGVAARERSFPLRGVRAWTPGNLLNPVLVVVGQGVANAHRRLTLSG